MATGDDFLTSLAGQEDDERTRRKQAIDDATEEYLLGRLQANRDTNFHPLTVKDLAFKYGVKPGQIEHKIFRLRQYRQRQLDAGEDDAGMLGFLGQLLNGLAEAQAERNGNAGSE